ncbi:exonuclease domain-containing protein [Ornithinimicrobium murale]|uniref:3'-5' exonuclease n=1 Tax=Ornithinimicrobium murale TaxID=1050153 RepID=UPI00192E08DE|nr:exonuclease domain-containing protein [Ornithinimicrobium murale]
MRELDLLAVDLETTGLDPSRHQILSIGMIPVRGLAIELGGARQFLVRPAGTAGVGPSATVHGITDDVAAGAAPLEQVLPEVLAALEGRVLLAHHASIEVGFLTRACRDRGLSVPDLTVVDTVRLQRRVLRRGHVHSQVAEDDLALGAARRHLGLPRYHPHDALTDALACAELYLAQVAALGEDLTLRQLLR